MTPEEAYAYLNEGIKLRTFPETLERYGEGKDIKKILTNKLSEYNPDTSRDSVAKKVRDWFNDKYEPSDRDTYFKICFALNFDEEKAQAFLRTSSDGGIHYRDMPELTYAFAFRAGMDYPEARRLYNELPSIEHIESDENVYTEAVLKEFQGVLTREEFVNFCTRNVKKLGKMHNTAYKRFMKYIDVLEAPDRNIANSADMSFESSYGAEEIVNTYLRMNVPVDVKTSGYTYIQKIIKKYWPNTASISGMKNRTIDVNRKTLILLYLVTEGVSSEEEDIDFYDEGLTEEEMFGEHYERINIMLNDCGFSPLDPRNVFDWLIIYAIKMSNSEFMTDELQGVLDKIFEK